MLLNLATSELDARFYTRIYFDADADAGSLSCIYFDADADAARNLLASRCGCKVSWHLDAASRCG